MSMDQQELRALEQQCIQECAPPCAASCPIHVDVRGVLAAFGAGDDDTALRTLRRALPFPGIIGRICEQPCRATCFRGRVGDPIEIAALERACVDYAVVTTERVRPLPKRTQRVAVVGGGLSGLTAAHDLARKGYRVTVFEALHPLGGRLWSYPEEHLPHALIVHDLRVIEELGVEVRLDSAVDSHARSGPAAGGGQTLDDLRGAHDAVFLATGSEAGESFGLAVDASGRITVDAVTFATSMDGVFAGGGMLRAPARHAAIDSVADGRRAAISIDRFVQGVSLTASRDGEGSQVSCLFTRTDNLAALPAVPRGEEWTGYSRAEAQREARRCIQCECLECVKVCEYLEHYQRYPRKAVREIYNNLSIVKGERHANRFINSCSLCGLCAEVCPTDVDMGAIARGARQTMVAQDRMPQSAHDFALRDMEFSQGEKFTLARNAPGFDASDVAFFPGCQLSGSSPDQVEQVYAYLVGALPAGTRVGLLLGCCGAPADWAGRRDLFDANATALRARHAALGRPTVVVACSSCHRMFRDNLPEIEVRSLWEVMAERGLPAGTTVGGGRTVSVHDACATRHEAGLQESIRTLLGQLGYAVEELPRSRERTTCCGYGGLQWLANPEVAGKVVARRVAEGSAEYVAYCAMCRDFLARGGKPTVHLLDLIYGGGIDAEAGRPATGWSERHENRARLKRHMLATVWGEHMPDDDPLDTIQLAMSDEVRARLEARHILDEDIRSVIAHAERTGRRLLAPDGDHFLASHRPTAVTYWVEYTRDGSAYVVLNAYSHRMEIIDDARSGGSST